MTEFKKFESDDQMFEHMVDDIINGKCVNLIETYRECNELDDNDENVKNYFLSDENSIQFVAYCLLEHFHDDIMIEMGYDTIEDDEEDITYKYMTVYFDTES